MTYVYRYESLLRTTHTMDTWSWGSCSAETTQRTCNWPRMANLLATLWVQGAGRAGGDAWHCHCPYTAVAV
jgi:hypothetical protein